MGGSPVAACRTASATRVVSAAGEGRWRIMAYLGVRTLLCEQGSDPVPGRTFAIIRA